MCPEDFLPNVKKNVLPLCFITICKLRLLALSVILKDIAGSSSVFNEFVLGFILPYL